VIYLGVDPGASGAVAALDDHGNLLCVDDLPYIDGHVVPPLLADVLLRGDGPRAAWVERAQSMPGMGVSGAFRYGAGYGVVLGVLGALNIPVHTVPPSVWKKAAGLSRDKAASRRRAADLWPGHAELFARARDDGRAEAALIARHGWLVERKEAAA
jgi:crossover junction endodeoxyribonuclease RuvC